MRKITVINPATGRVVECRIDGLTHAELEAVPLDDQICDEVAREVAMRGLSARSAAEHM
jgi:hypothetical protein